MYRPTPDASIDMVTPIAPPHAAPAISIAGLSKSYGPTLAVDAVSFDVRRGEIFGLLGKNGAGKTSIFEIVEGLRQPSAGTVSVCGHDVVRAARQARASLGAMLQNSSFIAGLHLHELVTLYASLKHCKVDADKGLAALDLADKRKSLIRHLSGGQKQRFAFLIATLGNPDLLLLDEPSAGLDVRARRQMWDLIREYRDSGRTVLLSTHYMEEAEQLCDRVAILQRGKMVALGAPQEMIAALAWPAPDSSEYSRAPSLEDVFLTVTTPDEEEEATDA